MRELYENKALFENQTVNQTAPILREREASQRTADVCKKRASDTAAEIGSLEREVVELETMRGAMLPRAADLSRCAEEAAIVVRFGQAKKETLEAIEKEGSDVRAAIANIEKEIQNRRRSVEELRAGLRMAADHDSVKTGRALSELIAPVIESACALVTGLLAMPNGSGAIARFTASMGNRSESSRFATATLGKVLADVLAGNSDILANAVNDLRRTAPDLITPAMELFLTNMKFVVSELRRSDVDAKAESAQNFREYVTAQRALEIEFTKPPESKYASANVHA